MYRDIIYNLIILSFVLYNTYLLAIDKITFYIHPRFIWLTVLMSVFALVASLIGIYFGVRRLRNSSGHGGEGKPILISEMLVVLVLLFGFLILPAPLSSVTASQRISNLNSSRLLDGEESVEVTENVGDEKQDYSGVVLGEIPDEEKSLADWAHFFFYTDINEVFVDRPTNVKGFILDDGSLPDGYFYLTRFKVTCCAVDASPVAALVRYDWEGSYEENQWVEISGSFALDSDHDFEDPIIIPDEIKGIDVPNDPYIY